jgi:hypothetical protein
MFVYYFILSFVYLNIILCYVCILFYLMFVFYFILSDHPTGPERFDRGVSLKRDLREIDFCLSIEILSLFAA